MCAVLERWASREGREYLRCGSCMLTMYMWHDCANEYARREMVVHCHVRQSDLKCIAKYVGEFDSIEGACDIENVVRKGIQVCKGLVVQSW